mgnify:CR=1 FL=1
MRSIFLTFWAFFLILLPGLFLPVKAQYSSMVSENHLWSSVEIHCLPGYNSFSSKYFSFLRDTVIGETVYKQLFATENVDQTDWYLWGFYREDTTTGHVWYRPVFPETEGLIYDFSAMEGDTVTIMNPDISYDPIKLVVQEVTWEWMGGHQRKKMKMWEAGSFQAEFWLEGIGSLYGMKNSGATFLGAACGSEELLCFSESGNPVYNNPAYETCFFELTGAKESSLAAEVSVAPNPAREWVRISNISNTPLLFEVYNNRGVRMLIQEVAENQITLDVRKFQKGLYYFRFGNGNDSQTIKVVLL